MTTNTQKPLSIEEARKLGDEIINGFHDVFENAQRNHKKGLPITLLASCFAAEIKLISSKYPQFFSMVVEAVERQNIKASNDG